MSIKAQLARRFPARRFFGIRQRPDPLKPNVRGRRVLVGLVLCLAIASAASTAAASASTADMPVRDLRATPPDNVGTRDASGAFLPSESGHSALRFEPNKGQLPEPVDYFARGRGHDVSLHDGGAIVHLYRALDASRPTAAPDAPDRDSPDRDSVPGAEQASAARSRTRFSIRRFGMEFVGMAEPGDPEGTGKQASRSHYLAGADAEDWHTDIPGYGRVRYAEAYPGIDIVFRGDSGRIRHDFIVEPGADPGRIRVRYRGVDGLSLNDQGDLVLSLGGQDIVQRAPVAFQRVPGGGRERVAARYAIDGETVRFDLGGYDQDRELVIDPTLEYSSYFGGPGLEVPVGLDVDADGNIYVFAETDSPGLATAGAFQDMRGALREVNTVSVNCPDCTDSDGIGFVTRTEITATHSILISKFAPDGTTLLWSTYVSSSEGGLGFGLGVNSVAVTPNGEAAFGAGRAGPGLPLANATQQFPPGGSADYVAKLNSAGSGLVFGTYLQTADFPLLRGLDVSATGQVIAVGTADSNGNPPVVSPLPNQACPDPAVFDASTYVVRFAPDGMLDFASCIGGGNVDQGRGVAYGSDGLIYVLGLSGSEDFPTTPNAIQSGLSNPGTRDMTVSVINPALSSLEYSTYLGPTQPGHATVVDATGNPGNDSHFGALAFFPIDIGVDDMGKIYITGNTNLLHYPTTDNALDPNLNHPRESYTGTEFTSPTWDIYVTKLDRFGGVLDYSTYLGGTNSEDGLQAMQIDGAGNAYLLTVTDSADYPTAAPIQDSLAGLSSVAVTRLAPSGALSWSTYLGTARDEVNQVPGGLALSGDSVVLVSSTKSDAWPVTPDAFQATRAGDRDATISILDLAGDVDADADGVIDAADAFPDNAFEWRDTDGDGTGNVADSDADGDGVEDAADAFPLLAAEQVDSDGDGLGDNLDGFPGDALAAFDFDANGTPDFVDADMDGDGVANTTDAFKLVPGASQDCDGDGGDPTPDPALADAFDADDDNDGIADVRDRAPFDANRPVRTFEGPGPLNTEVFKSPLPAGFEAVEAADGAWTVAGDRAYAGARSLSTYDVVNCGDPQSLTVIDDPTQPDLDEYIDIEEAEVIGVDGCGIDLRFQLRGQTLDAGDPMLEGVLYRVFIDFDEPFFDGDVFADAEIAPGIGVDGNLQYVPQGDGISNIDISGNELRYRVALSELSGADPVAVFFDAVDFNQDNQSNVTEERTVDAPAMDPPPAPETNAVRLVDTSTGGQLSFRYRVDSEADSDFLRVHLNDELVVEASGDTGWQVFSREVDAGEHRLLFEYTRDESGSAGTDAAWIDNIAMNEPDLIFRDGGEITPIGERVTCFD